LINSKQRAYLKSLANNLDPVLIIGKDGISENTIKQLDDVLNKRELIKIKVLNNNYDDRKQMIDEIVEATNSEFVQFMGSKITLYRESEEKKIELPK